MRDQQPAEATGAIGASAKTTVYRLFRARALERKETMALDMAGRKISFGELLDRVDRLSASLQAAGIVAGDRVAMLSENRPEYTEIQLAAARLGAIVACLNWRLSAPELRHCLDVAAPVLIVVSPRFVPLLAGVETGTTGVVVLGEAYEALIAQAGKVPPAPDIDPESGLLLLYTSGTTGLPKAALISHRAEIARMTVMRLDLGVASTDAYVAWSPMFHMGGTEHTLAHLMSGAPVFIVDGFDARAIVDIIARHKIGWLLLVPATLEPLLELLHREQPKVRGIKAVGCMADLVPPRQIAELCAYLGAPFLNSFGATETGLPPASGHLIAPGEEIVGRLSKRLSTLCEFRLVDEAGRDVADGAIGEGLVRGPTLFSGYWNATATNAADFRDGGFRMGDLFQRNDDGSYDFVGRAKYLIKSGGENIYPAEIERVLLADPRVADAVVVRKPDARWGEVPVAFVALADAALTESEIIAICRQNLAAYKCPRQVVLIGFDDFARSNTGKIQREEMERRIPAVAD